MGEFGSVLMRNRFANEHAMRRLTSRQAVENGVEALSCYTMRHDAEHRRRAASDALSHEREIIAASPRKTGQDVGRADIGKKPDADLRHGELETLARDAVRAVNRDADPAAHDDAVDEGEIGFGVALDGTVERIFLGPEDEG